MTITHTEEIGSYGGTLAADRSSSTALSFCLRGSDDVSEMLDYMGTLCPASMLAENGRFLVFRNYQREQLGRNVWRWSANYADEDRSGNDALDEGEYDLDFDTTGSSVRVTHALAQAGYTAAGAAPNFGTAIDVQPPDYKPNGCEMVLPGLKFTVRYKHPRGWITPATKWRRIFEWNALTGSVNIRRWGPFPAAEVLFLGVTGKIASASGPEVQYHFLWSENRAAFQVAGITVGSKKGHELLWILWEDGKDDAAGGRRVTKAKAVYVSQLYKPKSWARLGCKVA